MTVHARAAFTSNLAIAPAMACQVSSEIAACLCISRHAVCREIWVAICGIRKLIIEWPCCLLYCRITLASGANVTYITISHLFDENVWNLRGHYDFAKR